MSRQTHSYTLRKPASSPLLPFELVYSSTMLLLVLLRHEAFTSPSPVPAVSLLEPCALLVTHPFYRLACLLAVTRPTLHRGGMFGNAEKSTSKPISRPWTVVKLGSGWDNCMPMPNLSPQPLSPCPPVPAQRSLQLEASPRQSLRRLLTGHHTPAGRSSSRRVLVDNSLPQQPLREGGSPFVVGLSIWTVVPYSNRTPSPL